MLPTFADEDGLETEVKIDNAFYVGQRVEFKMGKDIKGIVIALYVDADGIRYEVRWFHNGKAESGYYYAHELDEVKA
jgi:hypothetical protein